MDKHGRIFARPFSKFFNMNELEETKAENLPWDTGVQIFEKLDGSCGTLFRHPHYGICLSTPGSMQSDQAKMGTKILRRISWGSSFVADLDDDCTAIFEIIYPANRIVVDYEGRDDLVLLSIFNLNGEEWHQNRVDTLAEKHGITRPRRFDIDLRGAIDFPENEEGYVALFGDGTRIKVKSPVYLRIHRLLNYLSPKGVIDLIRGHEYRSTLEQLPPSIQRSFDDIRAYVQTMFDEARNKVEAFHLAVPEGTRKDQALWITGCVPRELQGFVFAKLDNKDITEGLWRSVTNIL
jgi:RNA ligase